MPLAILRSGQSALEALEAGLSYSLVSAGIAYQKVKEKEVCAGLLEAALKKIRASSVTPAVPEDDDAELWRAALVGAELLNVSGGCHVRRLKVYKEHHRPGGVFFTLRQDWVWNAILQARCEAGRDERVPDKPLSWTEFRLLAALLSAKVNLQGFSFISWESIQARAYGFHSKALFQAGKATLPGHCQPLSRDVIRRRLDRLEILGFFARCRYASGSRGGLTAYSFQHPMRETLVAAVLAWKNHKKSFHTRAAALRATDLQAFQPPPKKTAARQPPAHAIPRRFLRHGNGEQNNSEAF
ncbi:MAG: hypothetical protein V4662_04600 [Verrucomicrobiota bacterium]